MKLILLPGMDGTGELFGPLFDVLPPYLKPVILKLPEYGPQNPMAIAQQLATSLPDNEPYFLLGESFSGRIAFEIASKHPEGLQGVIYVASFLTAPQKILLPLAARLPLAKFMSMPVIAGLIRITLLGRNAPESLWRTLRSTILSVAPSTLSARLSALHNIGAPDAKNSIPSLHLMATKDWLVSKSASRSVARYNAGLETIQVNGPHFLLQVCPEPCGAAICSFIEKTAVLTN